MDVVFNRYIRLRDTQDGWGVCCSCGERKLFEDLDAGHFINCRWMSTRWREDNVHAQCISCNRFDEGNSAGYSLFMIDKYGRKHVEYLKALKQERVGFVDSDIQLLINEYKNKTKELVKA